MRNDKQLQSDIEKALCWEPCVRAGQIGVSVKNGAVALEGNVDTYFQKWSAERAALRVSDSRPVSSGIRCLRLVGLRES